MSVTAAQVRLYPLRQNSIGPAVREAVRIFRKYGLETRVGEMSTLVWGQEQAVFKALQETFHQAAACGDAVVVVTLSNACPEPGRRAWPSLRSCEVAYADVPFDERAAAHTEAWYETPEGRRADELEKAVLGRLLQGFSGPSSVLEVGCGTGHFSRWLGAQGLAAVGLDLSAAMLGLAQALDGIPLVQGDARWLSFADGAFDLTAMVTTLEFLEQPREALAEALRVARCGVVLGVLNRWSLLALQRRLAGLFRPTVYDGARFYGVGELKRLLQLITGEKAHVVWRTTLFPRGWPWPQVRLPWGGFIGMALIVRDGFQEAG